MNLNRILRNAMILRGCIEMCLSIRKGERKFVDLHAADRINNHQTVTIQSPASLYAVQLKRRVVASCVCWFRVTANRWMGLFTAAHFDCFLQTTPAHGGFANKGIVEIYGYTLFGFLTPRTRFRGVILREIYVHSSDLSRKEMFRFR
jgi:hypothetical protein